MSEYATALKIGTTCLVLDLAESRALPNWLRLQDALHTLKSVSRDPTRKWIVQMLDGSTISAIDLQRIYLQLAQRRFAGRDPETDWVLQEWEYVLDTLESDPEKLEDRIDWLIKLKVLRAYMAETGAKWGDDALHSIDLEYHNIHPEQGLYYALQQMGEVARLVDDVQIEAAITTPPENTRAAARGYIIKRLAERRYNRYYIDWDIVYVDRNRQVDMRDPFSTYPRETERFVNML